CVGKSHGLARGHPVPKYMKVLHIFTANVRSDHASSLAIQDFEPGNTHISKWSARVLVVFLAKDQPFAKNVALDRARFDTSRFEIIVLEHWVNHSKCSDPSELTF